MTFMLAIALWFSTLLSPTTAPAYARDNAIQYRPELAQVDDYAAQKCVLDLYRPTEPGFKTVVWFHGGGLHSGTRNVPAMLKNKNLAVVTVDYRLSPRVENPAYLEDAAAAVAWTMKNIERYGGDPDQIFVAGHSAGGYLAAMVGLDKSLLAVHDLDANDLAGLVPYSGHAITHFTIRKERGIPGTQVVVDEYAPLYHVRADAPPMLLITGDRELELLGRYEEVAYLSRMMSVAGHTETKLLELDGFNHVRMREPAHHLLLRFVRDPKKMLAE